jgi:chorismate mutase
MSALKIAEHHLTEAVTRLEHALAERVAHAGPGQRVRIQKLTEERDALARDIAALRQECERLSGKLAAAEREQAVLRELTSGAVQQLDEQIAGINRMIGE